jgi:hypothetical protein
MEMYFRTNILAIVGTGEQVPRPYFPCLLESFLLCDCLSYY